jgi:hypothetical protein
MTTNSDSISERRDREVERTAGRRMPPRFSCKVVGVSFTDHYPNNLYALDQQAIQAHMKGEPLAVVLRRNPANEYDANAIEVHVPALGDVGMVGHIERPIAARLAPELDAGGQWSATVEDVLINPDHEDRPGISIRLKREENT